MCIRDSLKPALSRGEIQVIGATTFGEYRKYIEKDQALERRFQPVKVEEPSIDDTVSVLEGIKRSYEAQHHVKVPDAIDVYKRQTLWAWLFRFCFWCCCTQWPRSPSG